MGDSTYKNIIFIEDSSRVERVANKSGKFRDRYFFTCIRKECDNEFSTLRHHIKSSTGMCKKCNTSVSMKKARDTFYMDKSYNFPNTRIYYLNCKMCGDFIVTKMHKKAFCGKRCSRNYHNTFNRSSTIKKRYSVAKAATTRSRDRDKSNKKMHLTFEEYEKIYSDGTCYYCQGVIGNNGTGLDRIDSNKPYEIGNVVPCCGDCNRLKSNKLSKDETVEVLKLLKNLRRGVVWKN